MKMQVKEQLALVKDNLPNSVELVAVSKTHPIASIQEAYDSGQRIFGESRPQELLQKYEALPKDIRWHMIGHLQTNKIKYILPFVDLIHSVDSPRLMTAIEKEAQKCERVVDVLLEIHVAQEETKTGWNYQDLMEWLAEEPLRLLPHIRLRGVMGIASNTDDEERVKQDFTQLKTYFDELHERFGDDFDTLSMGMSHDYPMAIECGATMVRVGSLIFGDRDYSK